MFRLPRFAGLRHPAPLVLAAAVLLAAPRAGAQQRVEQTNLVSDLPGVATFTDPDLVNPWGIAFGSTSPFWVANNGTGTSTLYNSAGEKQGLVVSIPTPTGGAAAPTGVVFNGTGAFAISPGGPSAFFLFATEDGTIAGWNPALGTSAATFVDNGASEAIYKGLALAGSGAGARLYAANFHAGTVDVFDATFSPILAGAFVDPGLPAGYAPFNVQNVGGEIFVTYALQDADAEDDVPGAGHGIIDVFDVDGTLSRRFFTGGPLDSPWGMTTAPGSFGALGGSLLVGNFGDGTINAFDPSTGVFLGALHAADGSLLRIPGLWGITPGNGGSGGDPNLLYFAAGIPGPGGELEDHGLFGSLAPVVTPEPASLALLATGLVGLMMVAGRRARRRRA
jgi:uncharacterized protein (TIGR03118 family)